MTAAERLESRLRHWGGSGVASAPTRFKNKVARGADAVCFVGADSAECLIVRALSITAGECQFTVSTSGAVYASESNGWSVDKARVYISGLSPLIDDAADILRQMRGPSGGRMFFDRENTFLNAQNRHRFLTVVEGDMPATVERGKAMGQPKGEGIKLATCPGCFQVLPATGRCDTC